MLYEVTCLSVKLRFSIIGIGQQSIEVYVIKQGTIYSTGSPFVDVADVEDDGPYDDVLSSMTRRLSAVCCLSRCFSLLVALLRAWGGTLITGAGIQWLYWYYC